MRLLAGAIAALLVALAPSPAAAGDDADLIPQDVLGAKPKPAPPNRQRAPPGSSTRAAPLLT